MPFARKSASVWASVEASVRLCCSSAVGPTARLPKIVRNITTPFVVALGTGRMIDETSSEAGLSNTTNWPLRGLIEKLLNPNNR